MWRCRAVIEEMLRSAHHRSRAIPQRTGMQSSDEHGRQLGFAELQARMCVCVCHFLPRIALRSHPGFCTPPRVGSGTPHGDGEAQGVQRRQRLERNANLGVLAPLSQAGVASGASLGLVALTCSLSADGRRWQSPVWRDRRAAVRKLLVSTLTPLEPWQAAPDRAALVLSEPTTTGLRMVDVRGRRRNRAFCPRARAVVLECIPVGDWHPKPG